MRSIFISAITMLAALVACQKTDPIIAVQGIDLTTDATVVFGPGSLEE